MTREHLLSRLVLALEQKNIGERYALIDADGLVFKVSPELEKECSALELPVPYRDTLSTDLYRTQLCDLLYNIQTDAWSNDDMRKAFSGVQEQGSERQAERLRERAQVFVQGAESSRTEKCNARMPKRDGGDQNYEQILTMYKHNGEYAGAIAEFVPAAEPVFVPFLLRLIRLQRKPAEVLRVAPKNVLRIQSLDTISFDNGKETFTRNYLDEYVLRVMKSRPGRMYRMSRRVQRGRDWERIKKQYFTSQQLVVDFRDITAIGERTPLKIAVLFNALEDPHNEVSPALVLGNLTGAAEDAVQQGLKEFSRVLGRKPTFKSVHFRTLVYDYPAFATYTALENEIRRLLDANTIPNESVREDERDSERKGLDVLVNRESAEHQS